MNSCLVKKQGTEFGAIQGRSLPHPQMQLILKKKKKKREGGGYQNPSKSNHI